MSAGNRAGKEGTWPLTRCRSLIWPREPACACAMAIVRGPRLCTVTWRNAVRVPHALAARCPTCERTILRLSTLMWAAVRHAAAVAEAEAGRTRPLKEH